MSIYPTYKASEKLNDVIIELRKRDDVAPIVYDWLRYMANRSEHEIEPVFNVDAFVDRINSYIQNGDMDRLYGYVKSQESMVRGHLQKFLVVEFYSKDTLRNLGENFMNENITTDTKILTTYSKNCGQYYGITDENKIFSGGMHSAYVTRCPNCGFGRMLPFKQVEQVFGKLKV